MSFLHTTTQQTFLEDIIRREILADGGYMRFSRFMEMSLYTPELGYYASHQAKFGREGDFITAPEITPLFAQSIAVQFQQILAECDYEAVLELGAGTGQFAMDVLLELECLHSLPEKYYIFEISADLRARQKELLQKNCPHLFSRIQWLDTLPQNGISGVIFANEVIDALPFDLFNFDNASIKERGVTVRQDNLCWIDIEACEALTIKVHELHEKYFFADGYVSEINLHLSAWIKEISATLKHGAIVLLDYGYNQQDYYHPERNAGTLMCHYQHTRNTNPLIRVGLQDITAHVDFTAIAECALEADLQVAGYTTQTAFLLACGILHLAEQTHLSAAKTYQQNQAIKTLTLPSQMGEVIKAMCLTKNIDIPLIGFHTFDKRKNL